MIPKELFALLALAALVSACPGPPKTKAPLSKGGTGAVDSTGIPPAMEHATEIKVDNLKFKADESKLEAVVKYAGGSSAKLKIKSSGSSAVISVKTIKAGKDQPLIIEFYEGTQLKFSAIRPGTSVDGAKANEFSIDDCGVHKLPWTGEGHENFCGYSIQDSKN